MAATLPRIPDWQLQRDAHGRLGFVAADDSVHWGVNPVRAFPLSAPDEGLALIGSDGRELAWIDRLADLPPALREPIAEELAAREFMPTIAQLVAVSTFATPSTWSVETDRGATRFVLKAEEDIRRLPDGSLLVSDSHGIAYRIVDRQALDRRSRRLLERFL